MKDSIPLDGVLDSRRNVKNEPRSFEELPPDLQKILDSRKSPKVQDDLVIRLLESKYVLSLILYLDRMSPVVKSDIYNDVARSASMIEKIDELRRLGVIQIYRTTHTNTNVVVITDKGRRVAAYIRQLLDLIDGE